MDKALDEIPISSVLGAKHKELSPQAKRFAREVAKGKKKVDAYRTAYPNAKSPYTLASDPYKLASDPRVRQEIEALELAERTAAYRTPARLREHVIKSLLEVTLDPETKAAVRVQALKVLGSVTEVAAFTDRKEVRTVSTSEAARSRVLEEIKAIMAGGDEVVDVEARSLLDELSAVNISKNEDGEPVNISKDDGPDLVNISKSADQDDQTPDQDAGTPGGYDAS